ncbi:MAG: hypothetical protein DRJ64_00340 [Thermoprotei archaeon]|nr:MAG: hypothetical protein DRJ64_00340 [Thermoprotei archaeon]
MIIEGFGLVFIGHASFLVEVGDERIMLDPVFSDRFWWEDHYEYRATPLRISPESLLCPKAVFITHDHGDHFDLEAVLRISNWCGDVPIYSTKPVIEQLSRKGLKNCFVVQKNNAIELGQVKVISIQNKEESPDKYSFLIEYAKRRLFYSGDCHKVPSDLPKIVDTIDILIIWPVENVIEEFLKILIVKNIVLMHYDRFKPGKFICNINPERFKDHLAQKYSEVRIIIPDK